MQGAAAGLHATAGALDAERQVGPLRLDRVLARLLLLSFRRLGLLLKTVEETFTLHRYTMVVNYLMVATSLL
jgi:hypothetical protein